MSIDHGCLLLVPCSLFQKIVTDDVARTLHTHAAFIAKVFPHSIEVVKDATVPGQAGQIELGMAGKQLCLAYSHEQKHNQRISFAELAVGDQFQVIDDASRYVKVQSVLLGGQEASKMSLNALRLTGDKANRRFVRFDTFDIVRKCEEV